MVERLAIAYWDCTLSDVPMEVASDWADPLFETAIAVSAPTGYLVVLSRRIAF
jgi:hypothetical protein